MREHDAETPPDANPFVLLSFQMHGVWGKVDSPLDNWLFLFSTTNSDFSIQQRLYCLWDSRPWPPRSLGGPGKSILLLLSVNWGEGEAAEKKQNNVDPAPILFSLYWSAP